MARSFSLAECDVIGFDLDHTLCRYNLVESSQLIYASFAQYIVAEKGYDKELLNVPLESWDFCCKGLVLDMEDGNFLKLAQDGTVLRASHGTKHLTSEEILEKYGRREWKHFKTMSGMVSHSAKYYVCDNYFDLPGALLCAQILDSLNQRSATQKCDFWKDIIAAIQYNYKTSAFKVMPLNCCTQRFVKEMEGRDQMRRGFLSFLPCPVLLALRSLVVRNTSLPVYLADRGKRRGRQQPHSASAWKRPAGGTPG